MWKVEDQQIIPGLEELTHPPHHLVGEADYFLALKFALSDIFIATLGFLLINVNTVYLPSYF